VIIKEVELENFVSHKSTRLSFDLGVTVIVGPNGAGKTSIFDGISFALFKTHSRGKDENLINRMARHARVSLRFSVPERGKDYVVRWEVRRKKKGGSEAKGVIYEVVDGRERPITKEAGEKTIVPEIEKTLDVEKEMFESSIYVRQGEIERLVVEKPAERKRLISKLLGIDDFERAWELMGEIVREYESRRDTLRGEVKEKEHVERELRSREEELRKIREKIARAEEERREVEGEVKLAEEEAKELESVKKRYDELALRLNNVEADLKVLRREAEEAENRLKRLEELEKGLEEKRGAYERYCILEEEGRRLEEEKRQYEGARRTVEMLMQRMVELKGEVEELERELDGKIREYSETLGVEVDADSISSVKEEKMKEIREAIEALKVKQREVNGRIGEVAGRIRDVKEKVEKLRGAGATCPLCGRKLTEEHKVRLIERLIGEERRLRGEEEEARRYAEEVDARIREEEERRESVERVNVEVVRNLKENLDEKRKEMRRVREELEGERGKAEKFSRIEEELRRVREEAEGLKGDYDDYRLAEMELERLGDKERLGEECRRALDRLREAESEASRLREEILELGYDEERYRRVKERLDEVRVKLDDVKQRVASLEGEEKQLKQRVEDAKARLTELEEKEKEVERIEAFVKLLGKIRDAYGKDGVQKLIRSRARPAIERYTREYLNKFNLEYSDVRLDEDYELTVIGPSGSQSVSAISGGERVALAIALRMAIAKVIAGSKVETMIMDEPTVFLDEERRRELIEILKKAFREEARVVPQLIIVSHDRELEDAADTVYVVTKEGGWSRVHQVEDVGQF